MSKALTSEITNIGKVENYQLAINAISLGVLVIKFSTQVAPGLPEGETVISPGDLDRSPDSSQSCFF